MITAPADLLPIVGRDTIARTLAANRFLELPDPRIAAKDTSWRQKSVARIVRGKHLPHRGWTGPTGFLEGLGHHYGPDYFRTFTATLSSRLLVNMAGTALENGGLSLDRISGQPFIPGSALKGIARAEALRDLVNHARADQPAQLAIIADGFGWAPEDWNPQGDYGGALGHDTALIAETQIQLATNRGLAADKLPSLHSGTLIFLPAFPDGDSPLVADVLTPHHGDYYQGNRPLATDDEPPVPILFPSVEKGARWVFAVAARTIIGAEVIDILTAFLGTALKRGVGAKTAAGYGQFDRLSIDCDAPKVWRTAKLTFQTPAFLAGANPGRAELRPASFRGALRWWFRAVGGTAKEETLLFGGLGARATGKPTASLLAIHIRDVEAGPAWSGFAKLKTARTQDPLGFTAFPLKKSGDGVRVKTADGHLPPETTFSLQLLRRRPLPADCQSRFDLAWKCFCLFGGVGYRSTRGYGSFSLSGLSTLAYESVLTELAAHGFSHAKLAPVPNATEALILMDRWVKARRTKTEFGGDGIAASSPNPLGGADRPRQASGIVFRVLRTSDQPGYALVAFAPPPERILISQSRRPSPAELLRIPLRSR